MLGDQSLMSNSSAGQQRAGYVMNWDAAGDDLELERADDGVKWLSNPGRQGTSRPPTRSAEACAELKWRLDHAE